LKMAHFAKYFATDYTSSDIITLRRLPPGWLSVSILMFSSSFFIFHIFIFISSAELFYCCRITLAHAGFSAFSASLIFFFQALFFIFLSLLFAALSFRFACQTAMLFATFIARRERYALMLMRRKRMRCAPLRDMLIAACHAEVFCPRRFVIFISFHFLSPVAVAFLS